jgi:peptidyl-prolyl isomerase D
VLILILHFIIFVHLLPVRQIKDFPTALGDIPTAPIVIADCGVLSPKELAHYVGTKGDKVDPYKDYPVDEDRDTESPEIALQIANEVRECGNQLFKMAKALQSGGCYSSSFTEGIISILSIRMVLIYYPCQNLFSILMCTPFSLKTLHPKKQDRFNALYCSTLHSQLSVCSHNCLLTPWLPSPTPREHSTSWNSTMRVRVHVLCRQSYFMIKSHDITLTFLAKALYRRALAHAYMKTEEHAEKDLVAASHLVPDDAAMTAKLMKTKQLRKEKKEKKAYKKLFN